MEVRLFHTYEKKIDDSGFHFGPFHLSLVKGGKIVTK
jgi:hypothetical protein